MTSPIVGSDLDILAQDGTTWISLALVETLDKDGNVEPKSMAIQLVGLLAEQPARQRMASSVWQNRGLGIGLDYNAAYGVYTRTPGIATPAGDVNIVQVPFGPGDTLSPLVAIEEFLGGLYVAQQGAGATYGGRIIRSSDGSGVGAGAFANVVMTDYGGNGWLTAGEYMRDLCLFRDQNGARYLYASSSDASGLNGRLHRTSDGITWSSTPAGRFGANGRNRLWRTYWRSRDGLSAPRMVTISGPNLLSYTAVGADPFDPAPAWIEGVEIDTATTLLELGGSRRHVYATARDGVYDLNQFGESPSLTSYTAQMPQDGNGVSVQYLNGYLYVSQGRGLDRIYVDSQSPMLQEQIGQCAPGWGTPAENDIRGYVTAMCPDQGYLVAAVHNPSVSKTFICWGTDRGVPDGNRNPLVWYGPEMHSDANYRVTRMRTAGLLGELRLWVAASSVSGNTPTLQYMSLPIAGAPLQDLVSGGAMRFLTGSGGAGFWSNYCALDLLPDPWDGTTSALDQHTLVTRNLNATGGPTLHIQSQADPAPGSVGAGTSTWPAYDTVNVSPIQTITPAGVTATPPTAPRGARIWRRIGFFSPNADTATPPVIGVLDACRMDVWQSVAAGRVLPLTVSYGAGIRNLANTEQLSRDPDWVTDQLRLLTASGRTVIRTRDGRRFSAKLEQVQEVTEQYVVGGKAVQATLSVVVLGAPL